MMQNRFLIFFLIFCSNFIFAQAYKPIDSADYTQRKAFLLKYKTISENYIKYVKANNPGVTGKEIARNYEAYVKGFEEGIKNRDYVFNSNYTEILQNYFGKIKNYNSNGNESISVLLSKDNTPNAYCVQDGIFVVNMGLFNWIDNEDQLVAVLAHEWGHKILNHSEKWQKKVLEKEQNTKDLVSEISYSKVNKTEKAFHLYKNQAYEASIYRRKNESEADSIGYVIFRKTDLKKEEFINSLKNIEKYDSISPALVSKEIYKNLFDLPNHPFKEKWLKMEDFSVYNYNHFKEKLNKDSLATHPEVAERISHLKKIFPELAKDETSKPSNSADFLALKKMSRFEILPDFYQSEDYGAGIYATLQFLQKGETEIPCKEWLGKYFDKIYEARKNYNLNRYLDRVDPKNQDESYQQFLNFMWNLSLDDIKIIADFYSSS